MSNPSKGIWKWVLELGDRKMGSKEAREIFLSGTWSSSEVNE
jgi:hypothetical protein